MDLDWARADSLLDPTVHFLNHGSFGACPRPVFERYLGWAAELEHQPVEFFARRLPGLLAESRAELAAYVGAAADDLVYVPNATHAVNIVARSLRLGPGDEVLATDHEYGACDRVWRYLSARQGFTYRRAALPLPVTSREALVEAVWSAVTERTRLLFVSQITSVTALTFPVAELCRRARAAGLLTLVDGAHVPGQLALDVMALGADFYAGNCHKWLCAPKGAGFLHARPEAQPLLGPLVVSWGWEPELPGPSPFVDQLELTGTRDMAAALTVPEAIRYQAEHDWPAVQAACRALLAEARRRTLEIDGVEPVSAEDPAWFAQMAAFRLPPQPDPAAFGAALYERHRVEAPVYSWNGHTLARISIQAYNTDADVEAWLQGLGGLLGDASATAHGHVPAV
jgi:isopenicillin-N epimerase